MMIVINANDPMMSANVIRNTRNESETILSTVPMSSEDLFTIHPRVAVSKKLVGACTAEMVASR